MQESKYQVINWKKWKDTKRLLEETRDQLKDDRKAITYSNEMPGTNHLSVIQRYNKILEKTELFDDYIYAYKVVIERLENCIASLLNQEQRKAVIIYANNPGKGESGTREQEALKQGFSRAKFYELINQSFNILDAVLDLKPMQKMEDRLIQD
ncbi:hypothetical protein DWW76_12705 [Coprobacillus sp. AF17-11AC]|nr:hypothetical protein DWW80_11625 [Coprobacillus sp. AF17-17AC]RGG83494.1 hypothetical protein DWW76_12705 [Coprobacillus sp. AF17-11AC]